MPINFPRRLKECKKTVRERKKNRYSDNQLINESSFSGKHVLIYFEKQYKRKKYLNISSHTTQFVQSNQF